MDVRRYTDDCEVIKAWSCPDAELQTMLRILPRLPMSCRSDYQECIRLHKSYIESGLVNVPWTYQETLQALDPYLRLRYDMQCQCHVIERIDTSLRAWVRLFRWADPDTGRAKSLSLESLREIVGKLQAADMRKADSPAEYLKIKREKAAQVQAQNDRRSTDELLAVIDGMSSRQINEFVAAEKAIASGERIDVRGQDADTMNMWYEISRSGRGSSIPSPMEAMNPGMKPGEYVRR